MRRCYPARCLMGLAVLYAFTALISQRAVASEVGIGAPANHLEGTPPLRETLSDCPMCRKSISIPFIRIALIETVMLTVSAAIWTDGYSPVRVKRNAAQFRASWSDPPEFHFTPNLLSSDGDWWYFNLLAHGLFGSEPYLAARDWGHRPAIAFLFAFFASTSWEYLIEGWFKQPSAVDLAWSPAFGSLIGELRYRAVRATRRIRNRHLSSVLRSIVDPLGEMERTVMHCR